MNKIFKKIRYHIFLLEAFKDEVAEQMHFNDWKELKESKDSYTKQIAKSILKMKIQEAKKQQDFTHEPSIERMLEVFNKSTQNPNKWLLFKKAYRYGFDDCKSFRK
jgi:hypothetical protein